MFTQRKYSIVICFSLLFALFLSAGCGTKEVAPPDTDVVRKQLIGKVWNCEMLFEREVTGENKLTIEFMEDGTVKGHAGCNDYSGTYTLAGDKLSFGPLMSTKKSCGPALDEQEFTYQSFLARINTVKVDDDEMEMYTPEYVAPMLFTTGDGGGFLW